MHSQVGHAGTLDPMATGLLIICTGRATKQIDAFVAHAQGVQRHTAPGAGDAFVRRGLGRLRGAALGARHRCASCRCYIFTQACLCGADEHPS